MRYKQLNVMIKFEEIMREDGHFEKFWNGVNLEEEEREVLEIRGCKKQQMGRKRGELTA